MREEFMKAAAARIAAEIMVARDLPGLGRAYSVARFAAAKAARALCAWGHYDVPTHNEEMVMRNAAVAAVDALREEVTP